MANFKIEDTFEVKGKNLFLINQPFEMTKQMEEFHCRGGMSSYHDPMVNEPNWVVYRDFMSRGEVVLISSDSKPYPSEVLLFMAMQNGIGLTRDNLFMLSFIFPKIVEKYSDKRIIALMSPNFLPEHLNGPKICPMFCCDGNPVCIIGDYDWWWYKNENDGTLPKDHLFAFFKPLLV